MTTYLKHFGLKSVPLSKGAACLWTSDDITDLQTRFKWLLEKPGLGLVTGEPGVGKTAAFRALCADINPHQYQVIYHSETDFGRVDLYRQLALDLGLEPAHRRATIWRHLKARIQELCESQQRLPVWIIDEAHNLPTDFFRDFPSFINFAFDSKALMTVWFVGHNTLGALLKRNLYAALHSRIQCFIQLRPIENADTYCALLKEAFTQSGAAENMMSQSGVHMLRLASKGRLRQTSQLIDIALQLAAQEKLNHLSDDIIKKAVSEFQ